MSKDKKKKKANANVADTKAKRSRARDKVESGTKRLKALTENPLVADIAAAALVAMAAALKDSNKARKLAESAGDELRKLEPPGTERGSAMWDLALEVGRRALTTLNAEPRKKAKTKTKPKTKAKAKTKKRPAKASATPSSR